MDVTGQYQIAYSEDKPDGSGRKLRATDFDSVRIAVYYLNVSLPQDREDYLKLTIIPSAKNWFGSILKVQRRTSNIVVNTDTCINAEVPEEHKTEGIPDADVLIYVTVGGEYAATGGACLIDTNHYFAPLVGNTMLNSDVWTIASNETILHLIMNQFAMILGTSSALHDFYYNRDTETFWGASNIIQEGFEPARGKTVNRIILPTVVEKARSQFACDSMVGVEVE